MNNYFNQNEPKVEVNEKQPVAPTQVKKSKKTKLFALVVGVSNHLEIVEADFYSELKQKLDTATYTEVVKVWRGWDIPFTEKRTLKFF